MLERLNAILAHLYSSPNPPHPLDPLSAPEIEHAIACVRGHISPDLKLRFNTVTLHEPPKADFLKWLGDKTARPNRQAEVVAVDAKGGVYDGIVDLVNAKVIEWERLEGVQPMITMEDLIGTEKAVREDEKVIAQCSVLGIPREDMGKVYCDPWTIGHDERFGNNQRLQQALMYYRPTGSNDCQYAFPLDFTPIVNTETREVIHIDIPEVRRPINHLPSNYFPNQITPTDSSDVRPALKPINITQPEGVSFKLDGRIIDWQNWNIHIGFNHREGLVLSNITYYDRHYPTGPRVRPIIYRLSLAEMVVPYGNPEHPHQRKHAFDLGEYGAGYMTNSLSLGCDCKGSIAYLPFTHVNGNGSVSTIDNAICIHEEDSGILFKHTDFRDNSVIVTRARKLIISQIFTAANYEYCLYWSFHLDGTIALDIKLTGILNTYAMAPNEPTHGWGTQVHPGVNAHNHQHLFCLRVDPAVDSYTRNTVVQVDSERSPHPPGHPENLYGNAFRAKKTPYETVARAVADYDGATSRTWDLANLDAPHPYSGLPAAYKLVSRECPPLLPQPHGLVWQRAGFARHAVHVTPYVDGQLHPAGRHVPQTSESPPDALPAWVESSKDVGIKQADVVLWHTFGVTHFPAPEDFPVMPAEGFGLLLRPRNFFVRNPALDVASSYYRTPEDVALKREGTRVGGEDKLVVNAVGGGAVSAGTGGECCKK